MLVNAHIEKYLGFNEDELLMEIGQLAQPHGPLHSPGELLRKGRVFVQQHLHHIRAAICDKPEFLDLPEVELAEAAFGALTQHVALGLAAATATYVAKRGIKWLCADCGDDD